MLAHVTGHVIVDSVQVVDSVSVIQISTVVLVSIILEEVVITVQPSLHMLTTHLRILVIGAVKVGTTNQGIHVSVTIITILLALLVSTHLVIHVTRVTLLHQIPTIQLTEAVTGHVIVDNIEQATRRGIVSIMIVAES